MKSTCPRCEKEFSEISKHFKSSGWPKIDSDTKEFLEGMLIGDGSIDTSTDRLLLYNTEKEYVDWCTENIPNWLIQNIFTREERDGNRKDLYVLQTITHPFFKKLRDDYYEDGRSNKKIPKDFNLTSVKMKHWIAADGNYNNNRYRIRCDSDMDRPNFLESIFENFSVTVSGPEICFSSEETEKVRQYMGTPVPGYEYKWKS